MALSFTNVVDKGRRVYQLGGGLRLAVIDMTSSDVSVDYVTNVGFDLDANASKMGFKKIIAVLDATIRASGGTYRGLQYQFIAGKLGFKETVVNAIDHQEADTDTADGDIVRMVVIGV